MSWPQLYPLKFNPILKTTLWGGQKLGTVLQKPLPENELVGESWEVSGVKDNISVVASGPLAGSSLVELIEHYQGALVGQRVYDRFGTDFPLLIKFIDASQDLSIQVHPDDKLAKERHNSFGKTEMWYVIAAEPGATLISGFNKNTNQKEYLEYFNSGRLLELLNREQVVDDDVFFLPAGRVHTIGKGLLIAEIQQTSDITYRIYDFDRVDKNGQQRQLHVAEALAAIDYNYYDDYKTSYDKTAAEARLASCKYFVCNRLVTDNRIDRDYTGGDSLVILMFLAGNGQIEGPAGSFPFTKGDTYLIPANQQGIVINPTESTRLLEVYLPS